MVEAGFRVICERKIAARAKGKAYTMVARLAMVYDLDTVAQQKGDGPSKCKTREKMDACSEL